MAFGANGIIPPPLPSARGRVHGQAGAFPGWLAVAPVGVVPGLARAPHPAGAQLQAPDEDFTLVTTT